MNADPELVTCPDCNGKGWVEYDHWDGWQIDGRWGVCETCKGKGEVPAQETETEGEDD